MRALPDVHADSLWRKVLQASRSAGLPSTAIVGGGRRSANVPPRPRWRLPLAISKGHTAFKVGTGLIEEFLDDDSLLHLASVCKDSVIGSLRTTIEFVILMKRKLWSQDFLLLALQSGLAEHEMLSIVATAYRLLSTQGFRKPIVQWSKFPLRLWLLVLLGSAVSFNCTVSSRDKVNAFMRTIRSQHPSDLSGMKSWKAIEAVFLNRYCKR